MKRLALLLLWVLSGWMMSFAAVYTPQSVPDPKRLGQEYYVSNPDAILSDSTVVWLNDCAQRLNDSTKVEMAVVAIESIGDADAFNFSYELFQRWGIGGKGRNTGVLILFVLDSRDLQIRTGTGIEGVLTDARCSQIMHKDMFPEFKKGNYGKGICLGALSIYETCTHGDAPEELLTIRSATNRGQYADGDAKDPEAEAITVIVIILVAFLFLLPLLLLVLFQGKNQNTMAELSQRRGCLGWLIVGCIFFPFFIPAAVWFWWRSKRFRCPKCGKQQYKLVSKENRSIAGKDKHYKVVRHFCCSACGYKHDEVRTYDLDTIDGGSGYSGGGSYSSGSSYSGSSGGSWGGGSTSGGGAGGKW